MAALLPTFISFFDLIPLIMTTLITIKIYRNHGNLINCHQASLRMFMDLDLINKFNIDYLTLCRFAQIFF